MAHRALAVILEKLWNIRGALRQRKEVKRLAPSDGLNRVKLAELAGRMWRQRRSVARNQRVDEGNSLTIRLPGSSRLN